MNALRFRIDAPVATWDVLIAELHELGTLGVEERDDASPPHLVAWFAEASGASPVPALNDPGRGILVSRPECVPDGDWERRWREGLEPRRVGAPRTPNERSVRGVTSDRTRPPIRRRRRS